MFNFTYQLFHNFIWLTYAYVKENYAIKYQLKQLLQKAQHGICCFIVKEYFLSQAAPQLSLLHIIFLTRTQEFPLPWGQNHFLPFI